MKKLFYLFSFIIFITTQITAQDNSIFPKGELSTTDNHTGNIWLNELSKPDSIFNYSIAMATYDSKTKLDWHIHPAGQILLITEGSGYYQEKGKKVEIIRKGDMIKCMPGIPHWHGSTPSSSFAYVAVTPAQKGKTIWKERVTDNEYLTVETTKANGNTPEQEINDLSKQKWQWMSDKNTDSLSVLFDGKCEFVHMGGTWGKDREIDIIKGGFIWYKKAEVYSSSVKFFGNTAIVLSDIDLVAMVGGREAINPFMVTEVYFKENDHWKMGQLTFSHLSRPLKLDTNKQN